ncbi:MAG: C25 family cysteine peptidase [Bacteroidales bacterium]
MTALQAQTYQFNDTWGKAGISLKSEVANGVNVNFSISEFELVDQDVDGVPMKSIKIAKHFLPNDEGAPNLPGFSRFIAIPQGAQAVLNVKNYRVETISDVEISPAPRIPLDTEDGPMEFKKNDRIYSQNAFYPQNPFLLSEQTQLRGVDAVILGITPFQYNPVTKELLVYRDIEVEVSFEGGNGIYGEERLRSRWFDPILQDNLLNYASLPQIDYSARVKQIQNRDDVGCEYLIVVPNNPVWMPYAEQIKEWRIKQGIFTQIMTLDEIGTNTASGLENFFNDAYNNWDIPPVAVLLMADYGTNADNSIISPIWDGYCASDNIFADVNNNDMPDIIFARMTAQNEEHLQVMVSKMLDYEANPPTDFNFYHKPITALGWQTERWFQICSETVGGFWREVEGKEPVRINAIYSGSPGSSWSSNQNTAMVVNYFGPNGLGYIPATPAELGGWSGGTGQDVINAINDGAFALQHRDHGSTTGWGEPDFQNNDINALQNTNDNELVFVFSINCLTGEYNMSGECFAEKFHRHTHNGQNAGALGVIAASEVSYSFVNDTYVWGMFDNMNPNFMPDYGPYVEERAFLPAFGNAAGKYFLKQSDWPYNTSNKEVTYHLFHHHGGAFLQVYSEVPQTMDVTHNPILYSGESTFSVGAEEGAYISLTVNGEIIGIAQSTGGVTSISIEPQLPPNQMIVTVTKQNYFRYESTVEIIPPSGPYVVGDSYEINDASGNNNGMMDYGESITLDLTMKNVGVEAANNVTVTMTSADPFVTVTDGTEFLGTIDPDELVTMDDAFAIDVDENIPDNHSVTFELSSSNGTDTWVSYISIKGHAPKLEFVDFIINDAAGNNNGLLDPGETASMVITVENSGSADAYDVEALLTSSDPYVSVLTGEAQVIGDLTAGTDGTCTFTVSATASVPAGYVAELNIALSAAMGVSQEDIVEVLFPDYCYPSANCSYGDGFEGFALEQIDNMNNGCSGDGYGDFTDMIAELEAGQTYTVEWETGYSDQEASLWIDLNNNKEFEESERLITDFNMGSSGTVYSTDFTVPQGDFTGEKRLRIRANWQNSSADPCASFSYGETEDYTVSFGAPTYLPPPQNVSASVSGNDVTIAWDEPEPMADEVNGYNIYCDGEMVGNMVAGMTWTMYDCPDGSHWFSVTAVYPQGESSVAEPVHVELGAIVGKLQGFVRDAITKVVINNAWISANDSEYGAVTYNTPFGSHYSLHLSGGDYTITCDANGYQPITYENVTILEGATRALNFYLYPETTVEGQGTDVLTGINSINSESLMIYPNPAKEEVNISLNATMKQVKIINNMGQLVFDRLVDAASVKINTNSFQKGVYFVEIHTENGVSTEKLVIR